MEKFEINTQLLEKFFAKRGYIWQNETIQTVSNPNTLPPLRTNAYIVGDTIRLTTYPKQFIVTKNSYRFIVSISAVQCNMLGVSRGNFTQSFQNTLLKQLGPDYAEYLSQYYEQKVFDNADQTTKKISEINEQIAKLQEEKKLIEQQSVTQEKYLINRMQHADSYKVKSKGLAAKKVIDNKDDILTK